MSSRTKPRIALTGPGEGAASWLADYAARLEERGAEPVVLLPGDEGRLAGLLPALQGLLLSGGADVDPERYDHPRDPTTRSEPPRDALEFALLHAVLERDLPVLGICRCWASAGASNRSMFGGTLVQDLPGHRADAEGRSVVHPIRINAVSRLARITGLSEARVNSRHHQGVGPRRLGSGAACHSGEPGRPRRGTGASRSSLGDRRAVPPRAAG